MRIKRLIILIILSAYAQISFTQTTKQIASLSNKDISFWQGTLHEHLSEFIDTHIYLLT